MNLRTFSNAKGLLGKLLNYLGIIRSSIKLIHINTTPDHNVLSFQSEGNSDYFFRNKFSFIREYDAILDATILNPRIGGDYSFREISQISKIPYHVHEAEKFINSVYANAPSLLDEYAFETSLEQFKLVSLRVLYWDNCSKHILYEGSFRTDSESYYSNDFILFSELRLTGVPFEICLQPLYKSLIAESYILLNEGNVKLALFILYSALENFINGYLNMENVEDRLSSKLAAAFKSRFSGLLNHQIYSHLILFFNEFTAYRNHVAHGVKPTAEFKYTGEQAIIFICTLILSIQDGVSDFEHLFNKIDKD